MKAAEHVFSLPGFENECSQIREILNSSASVLSIAHPFSDGDALGSQLALHYFCKSHGKVSVPLNFDPLPPQLCWYKGVSELQNSIPEDQMFDVLFLMETTELDRIGDRKRFLKNARRVVHIDHHLNVSGQGGTNIVDISASSASEILFIILAGMSEKELPLEVLNAVYLGVMTDTGNFRFPCTSRRTHEIAGYLIEKGVDHSYIYKQVYETSTFTRLKLHGTVMARSKLHEGGKIISSVLYQKDFDDIGASEVDADGSVATITVVAGTEVSAFFRERSDGEVKISLRSAGKIDVQRILSVFGGGGHKLAAGGSIKGTVSDVEKLILSEIAKNL
ncbi:MAG: bifunctional oligoribonuclease/PAP phosphatase NrnA [Candidatus Riflebacteria bacterium]|nr:bifunctional oligoribonuclease/PAP phosphatase NrnA [Candidatus Riflebacteria bacterium]